MLKHGPYLTAAALCEKVLYEKDDVPSLIRLVDRVTVYSAPGLPPTEQVEVGLTLFIAFRGSRPGATHSLRVVTENADGVDVSAYKEPIQVKIAENADGANVGLLLVTPFPGPGRYFFAISIDGDPQTRVPLTIVRAELTASQPPSS